MAIKRIATRREMLYRVSMPYDTNVWYHVTDASNLQSIRDHGLVPYNREMTDKVFPNHSVVESGVYLSPTIAGSQSFATSHSNGNRNIGKIDNPIILRISNIDMNRLIPDPEEFNHYWSDIAGDISAKVSDGLDTQEDWENLQKEVAESGYPQFIIDNIEAFVGSEYDVHDYTGYFWAEKFLEMNSQQRYEITQYWKEYHPTSAFVYLGTIPAQNISIASYGLYGEEPSETDIMANAYDDYEDEFAANYQFQPMFSKITMALRPEDLQNWINTNGPYAYHDTYNENINNILKNGIVPLTELPNAGQIEEQYYDIYHLLPRPGFVYLHTNAGDGNYHGLDKNGSRVVVDLRKLDPKRFSADEDYVESEFLKNPHDELFEDIFSYPTTHPNWTAEEIDKWNDTEPQTLGEWASENAHVVDDPDVSLKSLQEYKTIAYQGIIPPEAIVKVDAL